MKRIISLMLICVLSLTIMPQSNAITQKELNEENATMYNTEMITYFEQEAGYPDHYGGAWLNQNSGHLVIGLTERNEEIEQYYYDVTGADVLEFGTVEYSLQELYDAMVKTAENVSRTRSLPRVKSSAIMQRTNSVEMYVSAEEAVSYISDAKFSAIPPTTLNNVKSNKDIIFFKTYGGMRTESATLNVGEGIDVGWTSSSYLGSIGYIAYRTNSQGVRENGFVTAGHTFHQREDAFDTTVYNKNGDQIGTCNEEGDMWHDPGSTDGLTDIQYLDNLGLRDYTFVKLDSDVTLNPQIKYDSMYSQDFSVGYVIPAEGSNVHKSGESTRYSFGSVVSIYYYNCNNFEFAPSDYPEVKRLLCLYHSDGGDSGAIVYTRTSTYKARVVGIHQGAGEIGGFTYRLVIPAYNIQNPSLWRNEWPDRICEDCSICNNGGVECEECDNCYEPTYSYERFYAGT